MHIKRLPNIQFFFPVEGISFLHIEGILWVFSVSNSLHLNTCHKQQCHNGEKFVAIEQCD